MVWERRANLGLNGHRRRAWGYLFMWAPPEPPHLCEPLPLRSGEVIDLAWREGHTQPKSMIRGHQTAGHSSSVGRPG